MPENPFMHKPAAPKSGSLIIDIVQTVVIALAITVIIYLFIATPHQVDGKSMENNFHNGDLLLANKLVQIIGGSSLGESLNYNYQRGDVIIFQQSGKPDFIKRIIAGPLDTIKIEDNKIYVNGSEVDEHYIPDTTEFKTELPNPDIAFLLEGQERTVPENKYFVMGDNRKHSQDSRFAAIGWVDRTEMKGKVFIRYWPLGDFGLIPRGEYDEIN